MPRERRATGASRCGDPACADDPAGLVRGDGSTAQEGIFDLETGEFLRQSTQQGYRAIPAGREDSPGRFTASTLATSTAVIRDFSRRHKLARTTTSRIARQTEFHHGTFRRRVESRKLIDTSAAAIAASGLLRLCRLVPDPMKGHLYWTTALRILRTLCDKHLANNAPGWEGILKGGVYHVHKELGVNESVMWGEYFFVEALDRRSSRCR